MSPRMIRWKLLLGAYDYDLSYRPGRAMANADGLSRLPLPSTTAGGEDTEDIGEVLLMRVDGEDVKVNAARVAKLIRKDVVLSRVTHWALTGWPTGRVEEQFRPFLQKREEISTHRGCLLWGNRVIIPEPMREEVLKILHEAHPGIVRMKALARSYVWWPAIDLEIEQRVRTCQNCQEWGPTPPKAPVRAWQRSSKPWSRLHMDFAGPFQGRIYLLVGDSQTKWLEVYPMRTMESVVVIEKLTVLFATHGLPDVLVSDNGKSFDSELFRRFTRSHGIMFLRIAPYHPASNGQAERVVQTTKQALRTMPRDADGMTLIRFLFNYRLAPHTETGVSPAEMLLGRRPKSLLDQLHPDQWVERLHIQREDEQNMKAQERTRVFKVGETVYMKSYRPGPKWVPGKVEEVAGPLSYWIRDGNNQCHRRHIDQLKRREGNTQTSDNTEEGARDVDSDTAEEEEEGDQQGSDDGEEDLKEGATSLPATANAGANQPQERPRRIVVRPSYLRDYV